MSAFNPLVLLISIAFWACIALVVVTVLHFT